MSKIVCIDPGHGGRDSGAVKGSRYEKNDNLKMAMSVGKLLQSQGITVVYTRTTDIDMSLQARTDLANAKKADVFISIHRNAFSNSTAMGVENWVYTNTDNETVSYATAILNEVVKFPIQANRGVKRGNFHVCRETIMPACLLELNFISNDKDNALYDTNFDNYAKAVAIGICKFLNVPFNVPKPPQKPADKDPQKLHRVQIGAFSNKENADKLAKELKDKGYKTFIV